MTVKRKIGWGIVGISVLMALGLHYSARSRLLPKGCTAVLVFDRDISTHYWWLSNSVVLLCRYGDWNPKLPAQNRFFLFNRVTHIETPLPELTAALIKNRMSGFEVDLSADKHWVLWKNQKWPLPRIGDAETSLPDYEILSAPPKRGEEGGAVYENKMVIKARPHGGTQTAIQTFQIDLPDPSGTEDTVFSRRGDKVAWFMGRRPALAPLSDNMQWGPQLYRMGIRSDAYVRLWVSDLNGRHMRELGYMPCPEDRYYDHGLWDSVDISDLQWLPDGNHLSFVHAHTLYVMPVE